MTFEVWIGPRAVLTTHGLKALDVLLGVTEVTGVWVCKLTPLATAFASKCRTSLYGQICAAVYVKQPFAPFTPDDWNASV